METKRYRIVSNGTSVDESLFGQKSNELAKSARDNCIGQPSFQAVVISRDELERIKNGTIVRSELDTLNGKEKAWKLKEERERHARERKEHMRQLERMANAKAKLSDEEVARQAKLQAIREAAISKIDEESDVVKTLTSMSTRAAAFMMRERQIDEKHRREKLEEEYNRRMDMIMEIDRLEDIQRREREEEEKKYKRVEDRKVITEQIEQRHKQKLLEFESRQQEVNSMRALMSKYETEDAAALACKRMEIERSRREVVEANEAAIKRKKDAKLLARKEVEDILVYQALKDAELAKREEEEAALERAKKERQARLLDQQEKVQSNAGKLDEIRARRAAEAKERKERDAEREKMMKKKADLDDLLRFRNTQATEKKQREEAAKLRRLEEERLEVLRVANLAAREQEERSGKQESALMHRTLLMKQIDEAERRRVNARLSRLIEGTEERQQGIKDEAKYSAIRDKMVADLEAKGVNPRFLSEMKAVDIGKIIRR